MMWPSSVPQPAWPPAPRAPLPPPPAGAYDRTLPFTPPTEPSVFFYRGNFCGVRVPGVAILEGMSGYTLPGWRANAVGSGMNPPIMALDHFRYVAQGRWDDLEQILRTHQAAGYTHLQCSMCHAQLFGLSVDQYVEYCGRVRQWVPFLDQWGICEDQGVKDAEWATWEPRLRPWLDAIHSNGLADLACVGWQLDSFNAPGDPIIGIIKGFANEFTPRGVPVGTHWVNEAGGWWQTGGSPQYPNVVDRFTWWQAMRGFLSFFHHQGNVDMDLGLYQAKLCDTLNPFGDGRMGTSGLFGDRPYSLVVYECSAQAQFDVGSAHYQTEDQGDQRGFYLVCTHAASHAGGYGNGGRYPDGRAL